MAEITTIDERMEEIKKLLEQEQKLIELQQKSKFPIEPTGPPTAEGVEAYEKALSDIYGKRRPSSIYDLASTVGATMLGSDPTAGAFRSMGAGFAKYGLEEKARRDALDAERRQIGMQAYQLAKTDEDAAANLMNQFSLYAAKQQAENDIEFYTVKNPKGLTHQGRHFSTGEEIPLNNYEVSKYKYDIVPQGSRGTKVTATGAIGIWQNAADARKTIQSLGMSETHPNFDVAVKQITTTNENLIGKPIIRGGYYTELTPLDQNGETVNILLSMKDGAPTRYKEYAEKRLNEIAKQESGFADKMVNVVPRIDSAMAALMAGVSTGIIDEFTAPLKQVLNQMFGSVDAEVIAQEGLVATSNFLAPKMRPVGSGSTSDMEFRAYQRSVLALSNTPQANYISLYAFKKMTENSIRNNRLEKELLADEDVNDMATINEVIYSQDTGIFEKLPPEINKDDDAAVQAWWDSLPLGVVVDNSYRVIDKDDPYVIKGFKVVK
jgi:hypothetical protein